MTDSSVVIIIDILNSFINGFTLLMIVTFFIFKIIVVTVRTNTEMNTWPS